MEQRKAKMGIGGMMIVAITFLGMGLVFMPMGICIYLIEQNHTTETMVLSMVFGGIGFVFFVLGAVFFATIINKKIRCNRLLQRGQYVMAEISEIIINYSIQMGTRHPYVVKCRYQDNYGNVHIFKSRNLMFNPTELMKDNMVKVYVDGENYKHYYVDVDEILPKVIEH